MHISLCFHINPHCGEWITCDRLCGKIYGFEEVQVLGVLEVVEPTRLSPPHTPASASATLLPKRHPAHGTAKWMAFYQPPGLLMLSD